MGPTLATLEFDRASFVRLLKTLLTLPGDLRPLRYSIGEDEEGILISDLAKFLETAKDTETGFFLKGPRVLYDISLAGTRAIICYCFLEVQPSLAKQFLIHMATAQPIFGFAWAPEEREYRNRVTTKLGVNSIESWVGRDSQKYVPGLYWLTLLPDALAEKHGVALSVEKVKPLVAAAKNFLQINAIVRDWK